MNEALKGFPAIDPYERQRRLEQEYQQKQRERAAKRVAVLGFGQVPRPSSARMVAAAPTGPQAIARSSTEASENVSMPMKDFLVYEKTMYWRSIRNMVLAAMGGIVIGIAGYIYTDKEVQKARGGGGRYY